MPNQRRHYSLIDNIINAIDDGLHTVFCQHQGTGRSSPAAGMAEPTLTSTQKKQSAGYMRVNHTGEVCAQALYRAQALVARSDDVRNTLQHCGDEETDHLNWCHQRLQDLGSHRSYLNPLWYSKSFAIGLIAGTVGDSFSLGFVKETEKQVEAHLASHLDQLPQQDSKSRAVVQQMQTDEIEHGKTASQAGARELPKPVKKLMTLQAKVMTTLAYWV